MEMRSDERISVDVSAGSVGVTLALGEVQVSVRAPPPNGAAAMAPEQLRTAALRAARRALEVALQELSC